MSLMAFIGIATFVLKENLLQKILLILIAFSAGAMMGGALLHLMPEAVIGAGASEIGVLKVFLYFLSGFCLFFALEQFILWHHSHGKCEHENCPPRTKPYTYLILVSDGLHNFIDGLAIAASFVVSIPVGIATTLAVILHEVPQEIGDFGVLIYGGFGKFKALLFNFLSALIAVGGGIVGFLLAEKTEGAALFLLPFAAGNFIYIAASDLIPEIKHKVGFIKSFIHFGIFLLGIALMLIMKVVMAG